MSFREKKGSRENEKCVDFSFNKKEKKKTKKPTKPKMAKQEDAFYPKACKELTNTETFSAIRDILSVMITTFDQSFYPLRGYFEQITCRTEPVHTWTNYTCGSYWKNFCCYYHNFKIIWLSVSSSIALRSLVHDLRGGCGEQLRLPRNP